MVSSVALVGASILGGRIGWPMPSARSVKGRGWGQGGKLYPVGGITIEIHEVACIERARYVHVMCLTQVVVVFVSLSGLKWNRQGARGSREYPN
jgi:hypothetical protein